ncbi:MAG: PolC-type DNA polymerase III [Erysipelotrichaceae bacterium]|nr:PolC-type DNA polymerase III [Erysipelotrichaceae bacterium]
MRFEIEEFFNKYNYDKEKKSYFSNFNIDNVSLIQEKELVVFKISNEYILPYKEYEELKEYFKTLGFPNNKLIFKVNNQDFSIKEINHYLKAYGSIHHGFFDNCVVVKNEEGICLSYVDDDEKQKDETDIDNLKLYLRDLGYRGEVSTKLQVESEIIVETRAPLPPRESKEDSVTKTNNYYKSRVRTYTDVHINELMDTMFNVRITGQIFKIEDFTTRTGLLIQTIYVKDYDDACTVKMIENKKNTKEVLAENKVGRWLRLSGNYRFDNYANDYIFEPDAIEYIDDPNPLKDDASKKRVELHAHTKLSEMDGVSSPGDIVKAAYTMGHKAVAITDHLCLQGFHEAKVAYDEIKKADKETDFKVIYGCEMNMVEPNLNIVYNSDNRDLSEAEYIVFDLETTGLSTRYDHVIEFGAVLMFRGMVKEKYDFFVKPPVALSDFTKHLTHISEDDLKDAKTFAELKDTILDILKDRVLVAHNASFDFGFLNSELERIGAPKLTNPVIDTLDLSRSILKNRRAYRLGNMARAYNIAYDEEVAHRADYDADVLAQVFNLMLKDCAKENIKTLDELSNFQDEEAFVKNRAYHTTILCKNKKGLKDLFRLVSISNTDSLAVFGKANTKDSGSDFIAEPRIFRETINKYRKDLLIGSACFNGEVFEIAHTRSKEELAKAISFYDYIEVQPLENYRSLYEERGSFTKERLMQYLKDIIDEALRQNKLVVATGDVHYVKKEEKILRDVYINAKAIGGAHHPLYVYDKEKRANQVTADQRFLNTNEMLEAFYWYDDKRVVDAMVIENPNVIAEMCDNFSPFPKDLYAPKIVDALAKARACGIIEEPFTSRNDVISADDYLKELVYYNAHQKYGDKLDPIIEARIDKELKSIIGNGYGVIYFVCHLMVKRSNNDGYIVGSRGSVGSSLVATLAGITEVNPLKPYYLCPKCHRLEWVNGAASGYDLQNKKCPDCGEDMIGDGQNIPFETFLGFHGDKIPDIDLNFSGDYQPKAHLFTREIFGENNVFRAGTTSTVADKTAFGYVTGYCEEKNITNMSRAQKERLAQGCTGVKRTTGQHAGGIVVLPDDMDIEDITPIQFPANDKEATWHSTHFEFHDFSDNLLKFDILGHVDPTAMRLFENISNIDVKTIPMNDEKVLSLFYSSKALNIINPNYHEETGACGLPEFGTLNTRNTIEQTRPHLFSELVQISGLSHGTDVWRGNAEELIKQGIMLKDVIGCRDDIMSRLLTYNLEPKDAFDIMEKVRKGKGLKPEEEQLLLNHNVPPWYVESCKKIKYMFPKAHAVAYCIMAVRVAWFKVYYPHYYYVSYFTLRCDAYEIETMIKDADAIYTRMSELRHKIQTREASKKEKDTFDTLEVCYEMVSRGYHMSNIDLYKSLATEFRVNPDNEKEIIPPFKVLDGLGDNVAESIVEARKNGDFLSKEDLTDRTQLSTTLLKKLDQLGCLKGLDDSNQISLF